MRLESCFPPFLRRGVVVVRVRGRVEGVLGPWGRRAGERKGGGGWRGRGRVWESGAMSVVGSFAGIAALGAVVEVLGVFNV